MNALLRQLEAAPRKSRGVIDARWALQQHGLTVDEIRAYEEPIRERIIEERAPRTKTPPA